MINIILWIILGGVAGWLASIIMKTNQNQGPMMDIILGIVGAFIGGFIIKTFFGGPGADDINLYSLVVATIGAIILIAISRMFKKA